VNYEEAKNILLLYRNSADLDDPQIVEALGVAKRDVELAQWFKEHCIRQEMLRENFRKISPPAGLKERIISNQPSRDKIIFLRPTFALSAVAAVVAGLLILSSFWVQRNGSDNSFSSFQNQMAGIALRGYAMDLATNNLTEISAYLAKNVAPANYILPPALEKAEVVGCAVEHWQNIKVSMICFRTGKPLSRGEQNDLWLFVVDRHAMRNISTDALPQFKKVNRLATASWTKGDKIYFFSTTADEETLRKFL
jgi:hypothetical protein